MRELMLFDVCLIGIPLQYTIEIGNVNLLQWVVYCELGMCIVELMLYVNVLQL